MRRITFDGGIAARVSERLEREGILAAFTERRGGVSEGTFASLNLGLWSGDHPANARENRRRAAAVLGLGSFACVRQVHGTRIVPVSPARAGAGFAAPEEAVGDADGMVTDHRGVGLAVLAADCVPIALADPFTGRLAVVHAGWRGVARGILDEAIRRFESPPRVLAAVGPAIGPDHYEVGPDVAVAVDAATAGCAIIQRTDGGVHLDLPGTVAARLLRLGVGSVEHDPVCTACETTSFFSHRRDGGTGRQALVAVRAH